MFIVSHLDVSFRRTVTFKNCSLCPQNLEPCVAHNKYSNTYQVNEWMNGAVYWYSSFSSSSVDFYFWLKRSRFVLHKHFSSPILLMYLYCNFKINVTCFWQDVHQSHLQGLLKLRSLDFTQSFWFSRSEVSLILFILTSSRMMRPEQLFVMLEYLKSSN